MAKDSFLMYAEWYENIAILSDEQAGVLIKSLFAYVRDENIPEMDTLTKMCFQFLKAQIDRDSKRYEEVKNIRSEAGKKGAEARWKNGKNSKRIFANGNANGKNALYVDVDDDVDVNVDVNDDDDVLNKSSHRIIDDDNPDDDYDLRHEGEGEVHFRPTVWLGRKQEPVKHAPLTEEEKEKLRKRVQDFCERRHG